MNTNNTPKPDGIGQGEKERCDCEVELKFCNKKICPKALPDITEGEYIKISIKDIAGKTPDQCYIELFKAMESHQTTPPTDSKDRSWTQKDVDDLMEEREKILDERENFQILLEACKSANQTLRDNNSKLVKAAEKVLNNWEGGEINADISGDFNELKSALQSITQQDNKQKEV